MRTLQLRSIISREGIRRGIYAGYGAFMLRDLPFDAIEFVSYEQVGHLLMNVCLPRPLFDLQERVHKNNLFKVAL